MPGKYVHCNFILIISPHKSLRGLSNVYALASNLASEPELLHTFISQSLQPGQSVSLKCSAVGNPTPISLSWYVDGKQLFPLLDDDNPPYYEPWRESHYQYSGGSPFQLNEIVSHLNISSIRVSDSGQYVCSASNLLSTTFHSARLNVYGKYLFA